MPTMRSRPCSRARHSSSSRMSRDPLPVERGGVVPVRQHVPGQHVVHLRGDPRLGVHAVGDAGDRHLLDGHVGPEAGEHLPADVGVELGHGVGAAGQAQAHHGHVEAGLVGLVVAQAEAA